MKNRCAVKVGVGRTIGIDTAAARGALPTPKVGYGYNEYLCKQTCHPTPTRPKYRNDVDKPRGVHDYYNIMWDPHVYRGKTYRPFQEVERERAKCLDDAKKWRKRRRRTDRFSPIRIPKTPPPPAVEKYVLNLDRFLIEHAPKPPICDISEQTDDLHRKKPTKPAIMSKIGFDRSTEILPGELLTFDEEVEPVATTMGDKVLEQSLRETIEEEELMALRQEQNEFEERRRLEVLRLKRIEERCQKYLKRSERLLKIKQAKHLKEQAVERRVGARMFAKSYFNLVMPELLQQLSHDGLFECVDEECLTRNLTPWLNEAVETELCKKLLAGEVLDLLIQNLCLGRETEYIVGRLQQAGDAEIPGEGEGA